MAAIHVRSISLPSRSHPISINLEEQLNKLKALKSSSILNTLSGLKDLYESLDGALHLPNQQSHANVEEALDRSLRQLDTCSATRDVILQIRQSVQDLQSSLRRRKGNNQGLENEIDAYMVSRKRLTKAINRILKSLKTNEKKHDETSMLVDVDEVSSSAFESLLSSISKSKSKLSGWSAVLKLSQVKSISPVNEAVANGFDKVDAELIALKARKEISSAQVQNALKGLSELESRIQELEEELECLYRRMVKARVTLLNILNHSASLQRESSKQFCRA